MPMEMGKHSILFEKPIYIQNSASVVGTKEGEGPIGNYVDFIGEDDLFGAKNWEEAESRLQNKALSIALMKAGYQQEQIRFLFAGDLLGQSIASTFGLKNFEIPLLGLYGACSTCGEALILGAMCVSGGFAKMVACVTSSHFASAEKEFRFPLGYGNQRPLSASWTVTGSGAFLLNKEKEKGARGKIVGATIGKVIDYGLQDSMNMGACMAPAAADTIIQHFKDFQVQPEAYDQIITGDLGMVGKRILIDLLYKKGYDISNCHMDCGIQIFDEKKQDTHAGGSGCGCAAVTLSAYILKQLEEGRWNKILFIPTGALLSKTSFNEKKSVPGIAHAVVIQRTEFED